MSVPIHTSAADLESQNIDIRNASELVDFPVSASSHDVEYRYLTFESHIPLIPVLPQNVPGEIPPCPNLTDYDDPFAWSRTRKNLMTYLSCSVNITAAYAAGSYASPAFELTEKWGYPMSPTMSASRSSHWALESPLWSSLHFQKSMAGGRFS